MARIKAAKSAQICTRAAFEEVVDEVAKAAIKRERLVAELKKRHQEVDDKFGDAIKVLSRDIEERRARAEAYFEAHAGELCDEGRRSGATKLANYGVRMGQPTVTKEGRFKKVAWKALGLVFDGIDALKLFVRNQPEVNKDMILAVYRDLKSNNPEVADLARGQKRVLDEYGISVVQSDEFWIEPLADAQVKEG